MSVLYRPVQWTATKLSYDLTVVGMVAAYVLIYLHIAPDLLEHSRPVDGAIVRARAFGSCAFLLLSLILCIGPLARLDPRFLPLLYNRRHLGVITFFVALTHALFILGWYFNYSPTPSIEALLGSNTTYTTLVGFPFESLGVLALLCLATLAATSHDFWLSFLGPRSWKRLHFLAYLAYAALVGHVALGAMQSTQNPVFTIIVLLCVIAVLTLHGLAAAMERRSLRAVLDDGGWELVTEVDKIEEGRGIVVRLSNGILIAVFRTQGRLAALGNACAHQNGPLGEGIVEDGCIVCPWHGYQYRLEDGCSPAPFTERVPTYRLKLVEGRVWVQREPSPAGTRTEPLLVSGSTQNPQSATKPDQAPELGPAHE